MTHKKQICENCARYEEGVCEIFGKDKDFDHCVNFEWDAEKECGPCPALLRGAHIRGSLCDSHCGKFAINSGHPLSPCNGCEPEYTEEGELAEDEMDAQLCYCEVDEISIMEGHRCPRYIHWLMRMKSRSVE